MLYPETVEELAIQLNVTEWFTCTPVPESAMVLGEPEALLVTLTEPTSLPAAFGVKITSKVIFCPELRVTGVPAPVRLKPLPVALICDTVTPAFPELVTVTLCVAEDPALTLPNARLVLLNVNVCVTATPVPLSPIVAGEFGALLTTLTVPVTAPAAAGLNCTLKVLVCPDASVTGSVSVPRVNPVPVTPT